jgi:hypothetical protein
VSLCEHRVQRQMSLLFNSKFSFFNFLQKPESIHHIRQVTAQPNIQLLRGSERFCNFAREELRVDHILKIGRVIRDDVNDSLDQVSAMREFKRATRLKGLPAYGSSCLRSRGSTKMPQAAQISFHPPPRSWITLIKTSSLPSRIATMSLSRSHQLS